MHDTCIILIMFQNNQVMNAYSSSETRRSHLLVADALKPCLNFAVSQPWAMFLWPEHVALVNGGRSRKLWIPDQKCGTTRTMSFRRGLCRSEPYRTIHIYIYIHIDPLGLLFKKLLARPPKLSQKSLNVWLSINIRKQLHQVLLRYLFHQSSLFPALVVQVSHVSQLDFSCSRSWIFQSESR